MKSSYRPPRGLRPYLAGAAAARAGDEMSGPALLLLGLAVTGRPAAGSGLLASVTIAGAAGGPVFGALLDRSRRPDRVLAGTLAAYALGLVAVQVAAGGLPMPAVAVIALAAGLFSPAVAGGWTAQLPRLVTGRELARGSAFDALTYSVASLAGPALAAALAAWLGARAAVLTAAALVALAVPAARSLDRPAITIRIPDRPANAARSPHRPANAARSPHRPAMIAKDFESGQTKKASRSWTALGGWRETARGRRETARGRRETARGRRETAGRPAEVALHRQMAAGFAVIATRRPLLRATVTSVVSYAGIGMLLACCPVLGEQRLGGAARGALLISAMAAASLAANAILARRPGRGRPDIWVFASTLVIGASLAAAAVAPGWLTLAAVALAGAGEGPQLTALFAVRHRETPAHLRGQVYTTAASLKIGGMAAGAALAGPLLAGTRLAGTRLAGAVPGGGSVTGCLLIAAGLELCAAAAYLLTGATGVIASSRRHVPAATPPGSARADGRGESAVGSG